MKCVIITLIVIFINLSTFKGLYTPNLSNYVTEQKESNIERKIRLNEILNQKEFSEQALRELLVLLEVPDPKISFNQARLETGNFTSRVFKEGNNLFGMHMPRVRDTYAFEYMIADNNRRVAKYRSWQSGVLDYVLLIKYYSDLGYDTTCFYTFLININYCELGGGYLDILKQMT
jgi:hypothetical protein